MTFSSAQRPSHERHQLLDHESVSTSISQSSTYGSSSAEGSPLDSTRQANWPGLSTDSTGGNPTSAAKPLGQFKYLEKEYAKETPSCLIPRINELFKSISERYDIAVTNREKVDQALQLFKRVLEQDRNAPLVQCFAAWRNYLTNPTFTVSLRESSGDVKAITVRAEEIPRDRRNAQKHMRDLLDACNLFLQQREFLQQQIHSGMVELERLAKELPALAKEARLSSAERKQLPRIVRRVQEQFAKYPRVIDRFWSQVHSLMHEINVSVYVLQE